MFECMYYKVPQSAFKFPLVQKNNNNPCGVWAHFLNFSQFLKFHFSKHRKISALYLIQFNSVDFLKPNSTNLPQRALYMKNSQETEKNLSQEKRAIMRHKCPKALYKYKEMIWP